MFSGIQEVVVKRCIGGQKGETYPLVSAFRSSGPTIADYQERGDVPYQAKPDTPSDSVWCHNDISAHVPSKAIKHTRYVGTPQNDLPDVAIGRTPMKAVLVAQIAPRKCETCFCRIQVLVRRLPAYASEVSHVTTLKSPQPFTSRLMDNS